MRGGQVSEAMAGQHVLQLHRLAQFRGSFHRLQQRDGHEPFSQVGFRRGAVGQAARKIFKVILIFAGVVGVAGKAEIIILLALERFDDGLRADFPGVQTGRNVSLGNQFGHQHP